MKTITYKQIKDLNPCYEPESIGIDKDYKTSIVDFIDEYRNKVKSKEDIIWVLCRNEFMTDKQLRLFAVWCAKEAMNSIPKDQQDERSLKAIKVAEDFANGKATKEELATAWRAAWGAAWRAASAAALGAATAVASATAWGVAPRGAASAAATVAAGGVTWDAVSVAARGAARDAQIDKLRTYFL